MLIVFLAVPALQRNSRNTQRTNDASKIAASIAECLANKNGQKTSCDETSELVAQGLDETKMQQIAPIANIVVSNGGPTDPGAGNLNHANAGYNVKCNQTGDGTQNGTNRQAVVLYRIEVQGNDQGILRCLDV